MNIDWSAAASGAFVLGVGLALVMFVSRRVKVDSGALFVAVLFAPAILYLGMSGRLVEFKGLGLEAKFQAIAAKPLTPAATVTPVAPSASEVRSVEEAKSLLGVGANVVFVVDKDRGDRRVSGQEVTPYARRILPGLFDGSFEALVVIDERQQVLGYFPRSHFLDLLRVVVDPVVRGSIERSGVDYPALYDALMQTRLWDIVEYPRQRAARDGQYLLVPATSTNAQALALLNRSRQDVAVLTDARGTYAGLVRRADIVGELLEAISP